MIAAVLDTNVLASAAVAPRAGVLDHSGDAQALKRATRPSRAAFSDHDAGTLLVALPDRLVAEEDVQGVGFAGGGHLHG